MTSNKYILEVKEIIDLENNGKWIETIQLLEENLINNDNDENYLVRLILQCWYLINEIFVSNYSEKDYNYISNVYINSMKLYHEIDKCNDFCKMLIGYILSINPLPLQPYDFWEKTGFEYIKDSYVKLSDIPLAKRIYYGCNIYNNSIDLIIDKDLKKYFSTNTAIEKYFIDVFSI